MVCICAGLLLLYFWISSSFGEAIAIVEPDEADIAEIHAVQKKEKPEMKPTENTDQYAVAATALELQGISGHTATDIPSAIFKQEKIDNEVDNILCVIDGVFYLVSYNQADNQEKLQVILLHPTLLLPVQGYGWATLADAYEMGGLPCVINTLNQSFELDINQYIFLNSEGIWHVSDRLCGLALDLSQKEADALNQLMNTAYTAGENIMWTGGLQVYTRLTVDGDAIKHWQQACNAIIDKAKKEKQTKTLLKAILHNMSTNLPISEMIHVGKTILQDPNLNQYDFPQKGTYMVTETGDPVLDMDLEDGQKELHRLLYR